MTVLLKGKPVADDIMEKTSQRVEELKAVGIEPTLAIVRVGENSGDMAYERGAVKRAEEAGIAIRHMIYEADVSQEKLIGEIEELNDDVGIHGVLIFRPLPKHIDEKVVCETLSSRKDIDGITSGSMAGVFMDSDEGFPPCTAEACMHILDYYGYDLTGKRVTVIGRSLVIGKPVAMMVMRRNATVTVCHSRTAHDDFKEASTGADIVIAAVGRARMIGADILGEDQVIIDVGINTDEEGKLCGDVDFDSAAEKAVAITPVPGGVGSVTTAVLMKHVTDAAENSDEINNMYELMTSWQV